MASRNKKTRKATIAEKNAAIPLGLIDLAHAAQVLAAYLQTHDPEKPLELDEVASQTGLTRHHIEVLIAASALGALENSKNGSRKIELND